MAKPPFFEPINNSFKEIQSTYKNVKTTSKKMNQLAKGIKPFLQQEDEPACEKVTSPFQRRHRSHQKKKLQKS